MLPAGLMGCMASAPNRAFHRLFGFTSTQRKTTSPSSLIIAHEFTTRTVAATRYIKTAAEPMVSDVSALPSRGIITVNIPLKSRFRRENPTNISNREATNPVTIRVGRATMPNKIRYPCLVLPIRLGSRVGTKWVKAQIGTAINASRTTTIQDITAPKKYNSGTSGRTPESQKPAPQRTAPMNQRAEEACFFRSAQPPKPLKAPSPPTSPQSQHRHQPPTCPDRTRKANSRPILDLPEDRSICQDQR